MVVVGIRKNDKGKKLRPILWLVNIVYGNLMSLRSEVIERYVCEYDRYPIGDDDTTVCSANDYCVRCDCVASLCDFPEFERIKVPLPDSTLDASPRPPAHPVLLALPIGYKGKKPPKPLKKRPGSARSLAKSDRKIVAQKKREKKKDVRRKYPSLVTHAENC